MDAKTSQLNAVCFDADDPARLAVFWAGLLGRERDADAGGAVLVPGDGTGFLVRFLPAAEPKSGQNQAHFDLTSTSLADQRATVARALRLGARPADVGQGPDEPHVVLADPEGNEFCVIEPGNRFLAGCGFIGALACDGSQANGYFWSQALNWPLVWDQDQETAVQAPHGGTKISWGGPPLNPRTGRTRLHLDLAVAAGGDAEAETARLVSLGAARLAGGGGREPGGWVDMADPDGNEFRLLLT
ncbi:MAG TPA: VOC family protein [Trebonia sp.]|jgi:catechol 2,3-dioxygenase-like lactoylglutathione lyase family enzyme